MVPIGIDFRRASPRARSSSSATDETDPVGPEIRTERGGRPGVHLGPNHCRAMKSMNLKRDQVGLVWQGTYLRDTPLAREVNRRP